MLTVRKATEQDAVSLAPRLRQADLREIKAVHLEAASPEESLITGVQSPDGCYVAVDDNDTPQIIFGTYPSGDPLVGYIWMMATDALVTYRTQLVRETGKWLQVIGSRYPLLTNLVHAQNRLHIRWLQRTGFTLLREVRFNGHSFYEFARLMNPTEINKGKESCVIR